MICDLCHRTLTDPVSIARRYGPVCAKKITVTPNGGPLPLFEKSAQDTASNPLFLACLGLVIASEALHARDDMAGEQKNASQVK